MFIPRLYIPEQYSVGDELLLNKNQSHYASTVLRLKESDSIRVFNGKKGEYHCKINSISSKKTLITINKFIDIPTESNCTIHLAQGISRGDRFDYVIQKATELGVTTITPLISHKVQVKLDSKRLDKKMDHWKAISISAAEQSGRTKIPEILTPIKLIDWSNQNFEGTSLFCSTVATKPLSKIKLDKNIRLAIGPESGWSEDEEQILTTNFIPCYLGPRILRTETAPVVAISILQSLVGDL
jgi:16S rRNA (uracil1498-N3)-methyltransferase